MYIDQELLRQLKEWRQMVADAEGVPIFRVLSNATLENIALVRPRTREELLTVKGIAEKKADHYGEALLVLVKSVYSEAPVRQDSLWGAGTKTFQPPLEPTPLPPLTGGLSELSPSRVGLSELSPLTRGLEPTGLSAAEEFEMRFCSAPLLRGVGGFCVFSAIPM